MQEPLDPIDAYMLGAIIFAILSRSRWSDLKHIHQIWIERTEYEGGLYGFVEARTKYHKTATSLAKKQLYMPLVAPVLGVTTVDWTKHWVQACESLGVSFEKENLLERFAVRPRMVVCCAKGLALLRRLAFS